MLFTQSIVTIIPVPALSSPGWWSRANTATSSRPAACFSRWSTLPLMVFFSHLFRKSASILCSLQNCSNTPLRSTGERTKITNSIIVVRHNGSGFLGDTTLKHLRSGTKLPWTTINRISWNHHSRSQKQYLNVQHRGLRGCKTKRGISQRGRRKRRWCLNRMQGGMCNSEWKKRPVCQKKSRGRKSKEEGKTHKSCVFKKK